MKSSVKSRQQEYISRLGELYSAIEKWIKQTDLRASRSTMDLDEEDLGRYEAPTLTIQDATGKTVADLRPVGAQIVGAEGRVDIVGRLDRGNLLYVTPEKGKSKRLFKGIEDAGWYWIGETRLGRAYPVTKQLFLDLLSEVSDYDVE